MTEVRAESIWVAALAHPLRVSVLRRMLHAPAAPAELAALWQVDVDVMRRHFRRLHELGVIEHTDQPALHGAAAYVLRDRPATAEALWRYGARIPAADAAKRLAARVTAVKGPQSTVVQRLRERREQLGLSQPDLSRRVGLHSEMIGRIERGVTDPRLSVVLMLADELAYPPEQLFGSGARRQADVCE